ncbi:Uncharacterized conserved protein [Ceraceosorus bombacis]|uniref:Uncharacterized conserved protein n=1 Tax=Ceraceosorus bombacis TaxID=401625 RepID=A0A0P1BAS4_9BASI|nr:Uncharacterized conserved protein [Ceraceosorus bombacis]
MPSTTPSSSATAPQGSRWSRWGKAGFDKGMKLSDWASGYANAASAKIGGERFWPKSNDMVLEIEKCERILRAFTVEGIPQTDEKEEDVKDSKGGWVRKKRKVLKKIPPNAIKRAKGVCIYSSMRSGIAPFGGAGGAGVVMARLPDGSWSAPSAVSPNNLSAGLLLGIDFFDVVLLINTEKAMDSFRTHKFTVGAETAIAAGPVGAGTSLEGGMERAPIYSYVRSRGMYAGVEMMGQVFIDRFDENERFYYWPGIKAGDILTGKVRMPPAAAGLHRALRDAEAGVAQGGALEKTVYDVVRIPESEVMKRLGPHASRKARSAPAGTTAFAETSSPRSTNPSLDEESHAPSTSSVAGQPSEQPERLASANGAAVDEQEDEEEDFVREGERLRLPPTPQELEALEDAGIPDEEDLKFEQQEREAVYKLPPPPIHHKVAFFLRTQPTIASKRRTSQIDMDGPYTPDFRKAQYTALPPSPIEKASASVPAASSDHLDEVQVLEIPAPRATDTLGLERHSLAETVQSAPPYELASQQPQTAPVNGSFDAQRGHVDAFSQRAGEASPRNVVGEGLNEAQADELISHLVAEPGETPGADAKDDDKESAQVGQAIETAEAPIDAASAASHTSPAPSPLTSTSSALAPAANITAPLGHVRHESIISKASSSSLQGDAFDSAAQSPDPEYRALQPEASQEETPFHSVDSDAGGLELAGSTKDGQALSRQPSIIGSNHSHSSARSSTSHLPLASPSGATTPAAHTPGSIATPPARPPRNRPPRNAARTPGGPVTPSTTLSNEAAHGAATQDSRATNTSYSALAVSESDSSGAAHDEALGSSGDAKSPASRRKPPPLR